MTKSCLDFRVVVGACQIIEWNTEIMRAKDNVASGVFCRGVQVLPQGVIEDGLQGSILVDSLLFSGPLQAGIKSEGGASKIHNCHNSIHMTNLKKVTLHLLPTEII